MNLCNIDVIRAVLGRHGFRFSKSLGQNFLIDETIPEKIAATSGAKEARYVIEIGPGMGCLTAALCEQAEQVVSIELDRALLPVLEETLLEYTNWTVIQGDVLSLDLPALHREKLDGRRVVACANLPYYITTPAITRLLESRIFEKITVMVQREVAERICAAPGTSDYSAFSIFVQYQAEPEILFGVPAEKFFPRPKVDSAVLQLAPLEKPRVQVRDEKLFFSLVRAAFQMRRKTLVNALAPVVGNKLQKAELAALLESLGLSAQIRGERLSLEHFAQLADTLGSRLT